MDSSLPKTYSYKPKAIVIVLTVIFFAACAAVLGWTAATNDRGLILNRIFTFSESGASMFYWILAALSAGFVLLGLLLTIQRAIGSGTLEITDSEISIPHGFLLRKSTKVEFTEVIDLSESKVQGQRFLYLHTINKKYCLNQGLMPSKDDYEEVKMMLTTAIASKK